MHLKRAVVLSGIGVPTILAATIVTWLPLSPGPGPGSEICVVTTVDGKEVEVLRTKERNLPVSKLAAGTSVKSC